MKLKSLLLVSMISLISISGCMQETAENKQADNDYYSYIDEIPTDKILSGAIQVEYENKNTPEYMKSVADFVVKATVQSIDYADMKYFMLGCTYGTISIKEVYYGDKKISGILPYVKAGGIIKMEDWGNAQPIESQEKTQNDEEYPYTYIGTITDMDIHLESGKTYLMYLNYHEEIDKYEIIGLKNGSREMIKDKNIPEKFLIKNNTTGEYEDLSEYLKQYVYE
ncbi:hypothetical protein WKT02_03610 [Erysipelotrichaceae bacterium HCN-30851]